MVDTVTATTCKARRGDLVALELRRSYHRVNGPRVESTAWEVREVTNVTREGVVKATRRLDDPDGRPQLLERELGLLSRRVIPAGTVDVDAVKATILAHTYDGPAGTLKPFDTLEELRDAVRPHLKANA
jgi:hypothetical protein